MPNLSNINYELGMEVRMEGFPGGMYSAHLGAGGFSVNKIFEEPHPGEMRETPYACFGIQDEAKAIKTLALTDVALANLDDLVDVIDVLGQSDDWGHNDPGVSNCQMLSDCKAIIVAQVSDPQLAQDCLNIFIEMASFAKPGRFLYRVRETLCAQMEPTWNAESHTLTVNTTAIGDVGVSTKKIFEAVVSDYVAKEGETADFENRKWQVIPRTGVIKTLANDGQITVTDSLDASLSTQVASTDISISTKPKGFTVPGTQMDVTVSYTGVYGDSTEAAITEGGKATTITSSTVRYHSVEPMFAKLGTTSHAENARALSIAYACMVHTFVKHKGKPASYGLASDEVNTATLLESKDATYYLESEKTRSLALNALDPAQVSVLTPFRTRKVKNKEQTIWSVDVKQREGKAVLKHAFVDAEATRVKDSMQRLDISMPGMTALVPFPAGVGGGTTDAMIVTSTVFDADAIPSSVYCSDYAGDLITAAGYGGLRTGLGVDRWHVFTATLTNFDYQIPQYLGLGTELALVDPDELVDAIRSDAEDEWNAAIKSIKDTGLTRASGCDPTCLLLVAGGAALAGSSASDDKQAKSNTQGNTKSQGSISLKEK